MDITRHIAFSKERDRLLWEYVCAQKIHIDHREGEDIAAIDILASDPRWPWISSYMESVELFCLSDMVFTSAELQEAPWLEVRSIWRTGYPEPSDAFEYRNITYERGNWCDKCSAGLKQVDSFRMRKVPSWGRRHFFSMYGIEDELFVNDAVKTAFEKAGITGIDFYPVKNKNGKQVFEGIYQLRVLQVLEEGLVESKDLVRSVNICEKCGKKKYLLHSDAKSKYRKEIFENAPDIVHTGDIFGGMPGIAARNIIISQKVYQTIVNYRLNRSLLFYPIDLV